MTAPTDTSPTRTAADAATTGEAGDAMASAISAERAALAPKGSSDAAGAVAGRPDEPRLGGPGTGTRSGTTPATLFRSRDPRHHDAPAARAEEWRFTPLRRLGALVTAGPGEDGALPASASSVTVTVEAPDGVQVREIGPDDEAVGHVLVPGDRPTALGMAAFDRGHHVVVPRGHVAAAPVTLTVRGEGGPGAGPAYGHTVVELGESAEAVVVLDHVGSAALSASVEVRVGANASLTLVTVTDWDDDALHLSNIAARVERDGRYRHHAVTLGGGVVRLVPSVSFGGPGARADLRGLTFADSGQHLEARLFVDHAVPDCSSDVVYRSALAGRDARTVWIGDVLIRAEATGTETYELNRNLLLDDGARADSVPNLEIETGEIRGAGHASATGRFDDEQVFYLQARGIPADEARRMVVRGFFAEMLAAIEVPALVERLSAAVDAELAAAAAPAGATS